MFRNLQILLLLTTFPTLVQAEQEDGNSNAQTDTTINQLVNQTRDSVVTITVVGRDGRKAGMGTGFVISSDGLIATNLHVIGEARPVKVRFHNGRQLTATEIYASDRQFDLAIIRVAADDLQPLSLSIADAVPQGTPVVALGNPMGLRHSVVNGIVSGTREVDEREMIQLAIPIEPGNSGGPLLNLQKEVVGIVTMKSAVTANLGFAIRVSDLKALLNSPNPVPIERWITIGALNPKDWKTLFGANWQKRAGRIVVAEAGDSFGGRSLCLANRELPAEHYEVAAFVRLDDESGAAGLAFGSDGKQRHYGFYPSGARLRLTRFDGPTVYTWQVLEEIETEHYRPGEWNHFKIRVEDDILRCFVNDQQVIERRGSQIRRGKVGLVKFRQTGATFKQFELLETIEPKQISQQRQQQRQQQIDKIDISSSIPTQQIDQLSEDTEASLMVLQQKTTELEQQLQRLKQIANDVHVFRVCKQLRQALDAEGPTNLIRAALLISRLDNRDLDVKTYENEFKELTAQLLTELTDKMTPANKIDKLNQFLFKQNGFHGSRTHYYHAANSYFDRVLDDREGLPITLSLLYLEMGRRLGLTIEGVGLPGHFVVRHLPMEGDSQLIDVFDGGRKLSPADARKIASLGNDVPFRTEYLDAYTETEIILRMLNNLQGIAQRDGDREAMLRYIEATVTVDPTNPSHRGVRAVLRQETGRKQAALEDLNWFFETAPEGIDLEQIQRMKDLFSKP
ncbi:MAG: tetratricopeptide repeat protein [Pirellulaceae bacterium]|nr:tetratricopeptide repeat protein [Pirellulaceae bacterium]